WGGRAWGGGGGSGGWRAAGRLPGTHGGRARGVRLCRRRRKPDRKARAAPSARVRRGARSLAEGGGGLVGTHQKGGASAKGQWAKRQGSRKHPRRDCGRAPCPHPCAQTAGQGRRS